MNKNDVIVIALDLFSRYGIKSVSMDSIAKKANISKRTLYEFFDDKESLLVEALDSNYSHYSKLIERLEEDSESVIDVFLHLYDALMQMPRWYTQKFYEELKKYPIACEVQDKHTANFRVLLLKWFNKGMDEGVFHRDVNFEIVVLLAKGYTKMLRPSQLFSQFSSRDVYNTILLVFVRGICTEKGNHVLSRHLRKRKYDQGLS